jgi:nucleoside-diphosphate-sugar epimerase
MASPESKRVLVTGGSGGLGQQVVSDLLEQGYQVTSTDLKRSETIPTVQADLTDLGQVYGVVQGHDAVVHLAAIPWPREHPPEVVFRNNLMSTFNVLEAACVLRVHKVVLAGSEAALGFAFKFQDFSPFYLPMDEEHPFLAQDAYGLSKSLGDELGRGFVRRNPAMSVISLRFSWIISPEEYPSILKESWANPMLHSTNLWSYIDARDAARACRLALEYPHPGFEGCFVAARDTLMREPTLDLVERAFPGVGRVSPEFNARDSVLDGRHAKDLLGFEPRFTWADTISADEIEGT